MTLKLSKIKQALNASGDSVRTFDIRARCRPDMPQIRFSVRSATKDNRAYFDALLRVGAMLNGQIDGDKTKISPEVNERFESEQIRMFAAHVVVGWENIVDDDGDPVLFSPDDAADVLKSIGLEFDRLKAFCEERSNFSRSTVIDSAAVAKK